MFRGVVNDLNWALFWMKVCLASDAFVWIDQTISKAKNLKYCIRRSTLSYVYVWEEISVENKNIVLENIPLLQDYQSSPSSNTRLWHI